MGRYGIWKEEKQMIFDDIMEFFKGIVEFLYHAIEWLWNFGRKKE